MPVKAAELWRTQLEFNATIICSAGSSTAGFQWGAEIKYYWSTSKDSKDIWRFSNRQTDVLTKNDSPFIFMQQIEITLVLMNLIVSNSHT